MTWFGRSSRPSPMPMACYAAASPKRYEGRPADRLPATDAPASEAPAETASEDLPPQRHTVGRERERRELRAAFSDAAAGRGSLVCVAGEPGIGKTTLVEDFLAELALGGQCTIARGRCSERFAGTEAYLPLLEALESLIQSGSNPSSVRSLKQLAPTWYAQVVPPATADDGSAPWLAEARSASQERMKRELAAFLQDVGRTRPLLVFLDDLHWADVSTIDMLSFLAGRLESLNVLVVVTYRPSDMLLAKHPFLQIKPDLQARGVCRELALEFLSNAEIAQYLDVGIPRSPFSGGISDVDPRQDRRQSVVRRGSGALSSRPRRDWSDERRLDVGARLARYRARAA